MGKIKKSEPTKIIREVGKNLIIEVTEQEKKYRNKNSPDDISEISRDKLKCTVCAKSLANQLVKGNDPFVHMLLNVLICKDCSSFYGDGYFSVDEDGDDKYCRWCAQGGTLYLCSTCTCAFCKKCIKQNLSRKDLKDLDSDDWKCFICKPNPLFECRTVCWFLQEKANIKKDDVEGKETPNKETKNKNENVRESRKRKASNDAEKIPVKKQKREDPLETSGNISAHDHKRRNYTPKEDDKSKEEIISIPKTLRSKRMVSSPQLEPNYSRKASKENEIIQLNEDNGVVSKKIDHKTANIKQDIAIDKSPNKDKKTLKAKYAPVSNNKPNKHAKQGKKPLKKKTISEKAPITSVKKLKRTPKRKLSNHSESEEDSMDLKKRLQLDHLDDDNSSSESENKKNTVEGNFTSNKLNKMKLSLSNDADNSVIQGSSYINSAITDVLELTILIGNRCEKLCNKSIDSKDDLLSAFMKLKRLMGGVHTNLELIEKGLNTKINGWQGVTETPMTNNGNLSEETKLNDSNSRSNEFDSIIVSLDQVEDKEISENVQNIGIQQAIEGENIVKVEEDDEPMQVDNENQVSSSSTVTYKNTNEVDIKNSKQNVKEFDNCADNAINNSMNNESEEFIDKQKSCDARIEIDTAVVVKATDKQLKTIISDTNVMITNNKCVDGENSLISVESSSMSIGNLEKENSVNESTSEENGHNVSSSLLSETDVTENVHSSVNDSTIKDNLPLDEVDPINGNSISGDGLDIPDSDESCQVIDSMNLQRNHDTPTEDNGVCDDTHKKEDIKIDTDCKPIEKVASRDKHFDSVKAINVVLESHDSTNSDNVVLESHDSTKSDNVVLESHDSTKSDNVVLENNESKLNLSDNCDLKNSFKDENDDLTSGNDANDTNNSQGKESSITEIKSLEQVKEDDKMCKSDLNESSFEIGEESVKSPIRQNIEEVKIDSSQSETSRHLPTPERTGSSERENSTLKKIEESKQSTSSSPYQQFDRDHYRRSDGRDNRGRNNWSRRHSPHRGSGPRSSWNHYENRRSYGPSWGDIWR